MTMCVATLRTQESKYYRPTATPSQPKAKPPCLDKPPCCLPASKKNLIPLL